MYFGFGAEKITRSGDSSNVWNKDLEFVDTGPKILRHRKREPVVDSAVVDEPGFAIHNFRYRLSTSPKTCASTSRTTVKVSLSVKRTFASTLK